MPMSSGLQAFADMHLQPIPIDRKHTCSGIHACRYGLLHNAFPNFTEIAPEYVAPLGSTSLIFNFLFAKFLVNTPVTWNDIYVSC